MFRNWIRALRPTQVQELNTIVSESPERVARLVGEELEVTQAVILLMALPVHVSEGIFRHLSDERAESFTRKASELGPLDQRTRDLVLKDALRRVRQS